MSLEQTLPRLEETQAEKESGSSSRERKGREHAERTNDKRLLHNPPLSNEEETTIMAEAFRAAARQRSKEESEASQE